MSATLSPAEPVADGQYESFQTWLDAVVETNRFGEVDKFNSHIVALGTHDKYADAIKEAEGFAKRVYCNRHPNMTYEVVVMGVVRDETATPFKTRFEKVMTFKGVE